MIAALLVGVAFGFFGSVPVAGPVSVVVFVRGAEGHVRSGLATAIGGALAEGIYAFLAVWGFSTFLVRHPWIEPVSNGLAAAILLLLGVLFLRRKPHELPKDPGAHGRSLFVGFLLVALNPTLIATWTAATAVLYSSGLLSLEPIRAVPLAIGAAAGIVAWFSLLLALVSRFRERFGLETMNRLLHGMGWVLLALGGAFTVNFVWHLA